MISYWLRVSWKAAVNMLYAIILIVLAGSLTLGGVGLVGQVQSLILLVQNIVADLPQYVEALSGQVFTIGPFTLDMRTIDLNAISRELLAFVQPLLGRTGNLVTAIASGAAEIFGWMFFVLIVSYFLLVESSGLQSDLIRVEIPGYNEDLRRLGSKLSTIWNSFLRGQIFIVAMSTLIYIVVLSAFGVRYAIGLASLAGLAKFLPYIGPAITWLIMALVTYFQRPTPFGMEPLTYMLMVVITTTVIDWIIDNLVVPRIMAQTLRVHPAAVLDRADRRKPVRDYRIGHRRAAPGFCDAAGTLHHAQDAGPESLAGRGGGPRPAILIRVGQPHPSVHCSAVPKKCSERNNLSEGEI
jgi:predicted PurR-regulated permease PerM